MTCAPGSLLEAAKKIQGSASSESDFRAVVNRAYYASYHRCRTYYAALPHLSTLRGNGVHEQLINNLKFPAEKLSSNCQKRNEALAKYLRDLCMARAHADYDLDEVFDLKKMQDAVLTADLIFDFSSATKGEVEVVDSPLAQA
ncbi:hypothetical protein [Massilia timonae]|uniref:hypothetical protein n=1 Tax=Massilia timonae TaxID=47229 RepID=UPI00289FE9D3|nr:hypothetical protein [Massilia timonae]